MENNLAEKLHVDTSRADYDSPWKEALDVYFEPFIAFFFPNAHRDINWGKGYESLDTELQEIIRDAETGRRFADKLVKVWLKDGTETVILIHIEVQSQVQSDFPKRIYLYNSRLRDKYDLQVISLAVLGDTNRNWRPTTYQYSRWGFTITLQFPIVKLLDYQQQWETLEQSSNPFAVIVMAHLSTQATSDNPQKRLQSKLSLVRGLYQRGYNRNEILELFRLIEWMMVLPKGLAQEFRTELKRVREENQMPYITGFERDGMVQNARESAIAVLETRFEIVPKQLQDMVNTLENIQKLKELLRQAVTVPSLEEFEEILAQSKSD